MSGTRSTPHGKDDPKADERLASGKRLREARILAGYGTALDAARALGENDRTYSQHENGKRGYRSKATKYADFFGTSAAWLMFGTKDEPQPNSTKNEMHTTLNNAKNDFPATISFDVLAQSTDIEHQGSIVDIEVLNDAFMQAMEWDKVHLGGKANIFDVVNIAAQIYKVSMIKRTQEE